MPNRLIYEGSSDCEAFRVIHSNHLQENATYRTARRVTEVGEPIRIYLDKTGNGIQPGDPVIIRSVVSGLGEPRGYGVHPDNSEAQPTTVVFEVFPPVTEDINAIWPVEVQVIPAPNPEVSGPGFWLQMRRQRYEYNPGMSDEDIEAHRLFLMIYDGWLVTRSDEYYSETGLYPPPPEEYEIAYKKRLILAELRSHFEVQWNEWETIRYAWEIYRREIYWPTSGRSEYLEFIRQPLLEHTILSAANEQPINPGGSDSYTLLVKEFGGGRGDRNIETDWSEILRVNFNGTPEPVTVECDDTNCPNHCIEIIRQEDKAWMCICSSDDLDETPIAETPNRISRKPSPGSPDPPPLNLGQRKAKARDYINKLQPKFDKAKAKYKEEGDLGEAAHNLHRAQDAIAKNPARTQAERDAAAAAAAAALLDRDDAILNANQASKDMLDAKRGLDALKDFLKGDPDDDSGISVGTSLPPKPGWRPPLVQGGNGWNSTPTYTNNNPDKSTTQVFGPSGGIQAAQVQTPTIVGGGGFQDVGPQSPQVVGGGGFTAGQWNATPTVIIETPEEMISQVISED